jgi:hypothetical protein
MTDDLDRVGPKGPFVTRTDEVSRRDFLARGGALTGGTVAAPALLGIGTTVAPLTAQAGAYSQKFTLDNRLPWWGTFRFLLGDAGVKEIAAVDVEWNNIITHPKGGNYVGRVRYFHTSRRFSEIAREYTFRLSYFYNSRNKIDIIPQSIEIRDEKKGIISPKIPSNIEDLASGFEGDAMANLPDKWQRVLWWLKTYKVNGLHSYKVEVIKSGNRALGLTRQVWSAWQIRTLEGASLAAPLFLGSYTVFKGFVETEWTTIYVPTVTPAMNGLVNNFDGGLTLAVSLAAAGITAMPALIGALGRGITLSSTHAEVDPNFGREYNPALDAIIIGTIIGASSLGLVFFARQYGIMRGRSAMMGFMTQCVYPGRYTATNTLQPSAWVDKDQVPYAGWEPFKPDGA